MNQLCRRFQTIGVANIRRFRIFAADIQREDIGLLCGKVASQTECCGVVNQIVAESQHVFNVVFIRPLRLAKIPV